ncbi:MAG: class I SAM-dependent methyltransferase [Bryobacteraceae bacterium]
MQRNPRLFNPIWPIVYPVIRRSGGEIASEYDENLTAFAQIYTKNLWGNPESRSGWGSTLAYTTTLRRHLTKLLVGLDVKTLLDAPCGDFNWMSHVPFPKGMHYIGADIVPDLIAALTAKYGNKPNHDFRVIDVAHEPLPSADLWLCRDLLAHLRHADGLGVIRNFVASDIPYLLMKTYDFVAVNSDARPGGFRYVNLRRPPFRLGRPRIRIWDFMVPNPPGYLGLWSHDDIKAVLATQ